MLRKIAIVGPESSGKTTLARDMAKHLGTVWVPEYARMYLDGLAKDYEVKDVIASAEGRMKIEP